MDWELGIGMGSLVLCPPGDVCPCFQRVVATSTIVEMDGMTKEQQKLTFKRLKVKI